VCGEGAGNIITCFELLGSSSDAGAVATPVASAAMHGSPVEDAAAGGQVPTLSAPAASCGLASADVGAGAGAGAGAGSSLQVPAEGDHGKRSRDSGDDPMPAAWSATEGGGAAPSDSKRARQNPALPSKVCAWVRAGRRSLGVVDLCAAGAVRQAVATRCVGGGLGRLGVCGRATDAGTAPPRQGIGASSRRAPVAIHGSA